MLYIFKKCFTTVAEGTNFGRVKIALVKALKEVCNENCFGIDVPLGVDFLHVVLGFWLCAFSGCRNPI